MNRYFYVPVTSCLVKHDGASLLKHLKMIDEELYTRGSADSYDAQNALQFQYLVETDGMYKERLMPKGVVIVTNDFRTYYEVVSGEIFQIDSIDDILPYEVSGMDVVDIFAEDPEYKYCVVNFFDQYVSKKNEMSNDKKENLDKRKRKFKILKFLKRNK